MTLIALATPALAQREQTRKITQISGDLYRFENNFHASVFLVTPEGVIATDPINRPAAEWLKQEIAERFGVPVRYVIYSHHHADHASGGEVFADTATFVGHENMIGKVGGGVHPPDQTFSDTMTVTLGGKSVELFYFGKSHSDNLTVMYFPAERTVFTVDFLSVNRVPFRNLPGFYVPDIINAIEQTEALDFDIVAPGHGSLGTRADVAAHREYWEELVAGVSAGIAAGKTSQQLQTELALDKYASWSQFAAWRPLNIDGAFRLLTQN